MTEEQKASEMLLKFTEKLFDKGYRISKPMMKDCAAICVSEIITAFADLKHSLYTDAITNEDIKTEINSWHQVKQQLIKL
jgi:hypothetical protein